MGDFQKNEDFSFSENNLNIFATINSSKTRFLKNLTIELNISGFSSYNRYGFILQIDYKFSYNKKSYKTSLLTSTINKKN
jgi:hypothetical protein